MGHILLALGVHSFASALVLMMIVKYHEKWQVYFGVVIALLTLVVLAKIGVKFHQVDKRTFDIVASGVSTYFLALAGLALKGVKHPVLGFMMLVSIVVHSYGYMVGCTGYELIAAKFADIVTSIMATAIFGYAVGDKLFSSDRWMRYLTYIFSLIWSLGETPYYLGDVSKTFKECGDAGLLLGFLGVVVVVFIGSQRPTAAPTSLVPTGLQPA